MKININGKKLTGIILEYGKARVFLKNSSDITFFKGWQSDYYNGENCKRNLKFTEAKNNGVLYGCYPTMGIDNEYVILNYEKSDINS